MGTAEKVLIVGGVAMLGYAVLLGFVMTFRRMREGAPATPRYLNVAHVGSVFQGVILLGLVWAVRLSELSSGWNAAAAWLIAASGVFIAAKDTVNWLTGVQDEFAEKAKTAPLGFVGAVTMAAGLVILGVGVVAALF
ncbi:hypothetical protein LTV02_06140 [Nocardia yamanashiensis]|uniref:hypothetical protein n=1 Tax=Nocardia yamanashiensis TaxID=209247 RepID=UPI001E553854|nr:hypothetical protein [Nocardia yamanashiensis]UGT42973.1 hypothetical protein LTV02_06140 [Nocardia yamanashiensis]